MDTAPHIVVAGAGAIGCFVGGLMAAAGQRVTLLLRPRVAAEITTHGLILSDFSGMSIPVPAARVGLSEDPACLAEADIVLVTVKSQDTDTLAQLIRAHTAAGTPVISLQNGVGNGKALSAALPSHDVRAGMVPFNVVPNGAGRYHRATSGDIVIGTGPEPLTDVLSVPHLTLTERADIEAVQWGKFLINLNNALNALSGLTLQEQLRNRDWRRLMADQWAEALGVLRADGIAPASTTPVSVGLIPWIMRLPTPLFTRIAASMLTIDAEARTSMAHDLMANRPTEIDVLQGEVVKRGTANGTPTPITAGVAALIRQASAAAKGSPDLTPSQIRSAIAQQSA